MQISPEHLHELFDYCPKTGFLFWKKKTNTKTVVGSVAGTSDKNNRVRVKIYKKLYLAHRIIWAMCTGEWPSTFIDHKDRNPANNCFENLRKCTKQENSRNKSSRKNSTSTFLGVSWATSKKKWHAQAMLPGKKHHLGYYDNEKDAAKAYDEFAKIHFGDFASLNFKEVA